MTTTYREKKANDTTGVVFIPAGLFLGMGCGFLFDNLVAGMFIGLGAGMILFAVLMFMKK